MHKKIARRPTFVLSASTKAKYREVGTRKCRSKHLSPNRGTGLRVRRAPTEDASPGAALRVHARRNGSGNGPYAARLRGVRRVVRFRCDLGSAAGSAAGFFGNPRMAGGAAGSVRGARRRNPAVGLPREAPPLGSDLAVRHGALRGLSVHDADRLAGAGIERVAIHGPSRGRGCRVPDTGRGLGFAFRGASGFGGDPPPRDSPPGPGAWCEVDRTFGLMNRVREPGASLWSGGQGQAVLLGGSAARSRESAKPSRDAPMASSGSGLRRGTGRPERHGAGGVVLSQSARHAGCPSKPPHR